MNSKSKNIIKYPINYQKLEISIFLKWFQENGGITNLDIIKNNLRYGTIANKNIDKDKIILKVPQKLMITVEDCKKLKIWKSLFQHINPFDYLTAGFLWLLKNDKFYQPYFSLLPTNFDSFPNTWSDKKIELLIGTTIYDKIIERNNQLKRNYLILKENTNFDFNFYEYKKASNIVSSRNFTIIIDKKETYALIPFADLLNHSFNHNASYFFDNISNSFNVISNRNIKYQDIVIDSYGKNKLAHNFLIYYGFLPNDYRNQVVEINNIVLDFKNKQILSDDIRYIINKKINNINNILNNNIINDPLILRILKSEKEIMMFNL